MLEDEHLRWGLIPEERFWERSGFSVEKMEFNEMEYELADVIIAGSSFVSGTLGAAGVRAERIAVAPYGAPTRGFHPSHRRRASGEPMQVAFVGSNGLLKGLLYAIAAVERLGDRAVHLHVFGEPRLPTQLLRSSSVVTYHGHLSRPELIVAVGKCHALLLPSLWEGSSLAVYEGLALGLPAIVTPNTGSVVTNGADGFVVPIRSAEAIADSLETLRDEELRMEMSESAVRTSMAYTWSRYQKAVRLATGLGGVSIAAS
ncbi:MAG: glycosyltransferase family 4 protein [Gemmatimonadaceae bacterium]